MPRCPHSVSRAFARSARAVGPHVVRLVLVLAGLVTGAGTAQAQGAIKHEGFFFGIGLGIGWAKYGGDASDAGTESGFSGNLRLGGHLKPNVLLAGETNGFYKSENGGTATWGSVMGTVALYPAKSAAFFVKGGAGVFFTNTSDDFNDLTSTHFAVQLGAGYDIKVGTGSAITLYGNWIQGFSGGISLDDFEIGDVSPSIIQVGVGFSLY